MCRGACVAMCCSVFKVGTSANFFGKERYFGRSLLQKRPGRLHIGGSANALEYMSELYLYVYIYIYIYMYRHIGGSEYIYLCICTYYIHMSIYVWHIQI